MIEVKLTREDPEHGTAYFTISDISIWDLDRIYRLLVAEEKSSRITRTGDRGSAELLKILRNNPILKKMNENLGVEE